MAHGIYIFAEIDGDTVRTESRFGGGRAVQKGKVSAYDDHGNLLLEGDLDSKGVFSFKIPEKPVKKIVLNAGMGHRAEWVFEPGDTGKAVPEEKGEHSHDHHDSSKNAKEGSSTRDIIAGLGIITVLTCIAAYTNARRKRKDQSE